MTTDERIILALSNSGYRYFDAEMVPGTAEFIGINETNKAIYRFLYDDAESGRLVEGRVYVETKNGKEYAEY